MADYEKPVGDLHVIYCNTKELVPYEMNSRTHSSEQIEQVKRSIKEFGFTNPILIDENCGIIAGHGRLQAAQSLGLTQVPCIVLAGLTEAQKKAYVIADNKIALNAGWDIDALKSEIESLELMDFDLTLTGFNDLEIGGLFGEEASQDIPLDDVYTAKIEAPIYEPTGDAPLVDDLFNTDKALSLEEKIKKSNIDDNVKQFLLTATKRHYQFRYDKIASFYAHASKEIQELMEESALVIIDYDKALENGYIKMNSQLLALADKDEYE